MRQVFFHIPYLHFPVYGYGVMLVLGLICGMYLAQYLARRSGLDPEVFANAAILALIFGVGGARLSHVLENFDHYTNPTLSVWQNFYNAINIRQGGLTYYGGFMLATPALILYGLIKKVPLRLGMDIIAPCLMIGLGFGRIGCYVNGCCYGAECSLPWAVQFPYYSDAYVTEFDQNMLKQPVPRALIRDGTAIADYMDRHHLKELAEPIGPEVFRNRDWVGALKDNGDVASEGLQSIANAQHANPVHPAEIYSSIVAFSIALFLLAYFTIPHTAGRVFAAMMFIEGVFRYLLEILRVEPAVIGHGTPYLRGLPPQSFSMVVSFFLVIGGALLWYAFGRIARAKGEVPAPAALAAAT